MDINSIYNTAKAMIDRVKAPRPDAVSDDAALCLIITDDMELFTGISGIKVTEDEVITVSAEDNAIMSMIIAQKLEASQMITVSFSDYGICIPDEESLELLFRASDSNYNCSVVISHDKAIPAQEAENFDVNSVVQEDSVQNEEPAPSPFADEFDSSDFNSGFDFDSVTPDQPVQTLGSPADFVSNITQDTNNPFYEAPSDAPAAEEPVSLNNMPEYNAQPQQGYMYQQGAGSQMNSGYPNQYQQPVQGYPQQNMQMMNGQYVQQPVNPYGQPVNPYGQPMNNQGMQMQQGGYMNGYYQPQYPQQPVNGGYYNNGMNSGQFSQGLNSNQYGQSMQYQRNSVMVSSMINSGGKSSAFRKRLNNYINDDSNDEAEAPAPATTTNSSQLNQVQSNASKVAQNMQSGKAPSIDEMMKDAKKQKKVAKVNSDFKKKMKDMGL